MKIYGEKADFFRELNDIINKHDWRHDNYNRYSIFLNRNKELFMIFDFNRFQQLKEILKQFTEKWGDVRRCEELLKKNAIMFQFQFFFKIKVPDDDPANMFGYKTRKIAFNSFELVNDMDFVVNWCNHQRIELYSEVTVDFMRQGEHDQITVNPNAGINNNTTNTPAE